MALPTGTHTETVGPAATAKEEGTVLGTEVWMAATDRVLSWLAIIPARIHIGERFNMGANFGDGDAHGHGHSGRGSGMGEDHGFYDGNGSGCDYERGSGYGERDGSGVRQTTNLLF
jgi:hypothetical protein